jgi:hypothetical protein
MQLRKTHFLMALVSVIVTLLLAACGGAAPSGGGGNTTTGGGGAASGTPEDAVKAFIEAVYSGEGDLAPMLCSANAAAAEAMRQGLETTRNMLAANDASFDVSGLTYTAQNVSGDTGQVQVAGKFTVNAAGAEQEMDFPAQTVSVRNEGGTWKVCG